MFKLANRVEEMIFIKAFGSSAINKVLMFLIDNNLFDYSKSDIAENCSISRVTLDSFFDDTLVKLGIITKTRQVGRAVLYKINFDSPIVKELVRLNEAVTNEYTEKILGKQMVYAKQR